MVFLQACTHSPSNTSSFSTSSDNNSPTAIIAPLNLNLSVEAVELKETSSADWPTLFNEAQLNSGNLIRIRASRLQHFDPHLVLLKDLYQLVKQKNRVLLLVDFRTDYALLDQLLAVQKLSEGQLSVRFSHTPSEELRKQARAFVCAKKENDFFTQLFWSGWAAGTPSVTETAVRFGCRIRPQNSAKALTDQAPTMKSWDSAQFLKNFENDMLTRSDTKKTSAQAYPGQWNFLSQLPSEQIRFFLRDFSFQKHFDDSETFYSWSVTAPEENQLEVFLKDQWFLVQDETVPSKIARVRWPAEAQTRWIKNFDEQWREDSLTADAERVSDWAQNDFVIAPRTLSNTIRHCETLPQKTEEQRKELEVCLSQNFWMGGGKNRTQRNKAFEESLLRDSPVSGPSASTTSSPLKSQELMLQRKILLKLGSVNGVPFPCSSERPSEKQWVHQSEITTNSQLFTLLKSFKDKTTACKQINLVVVPQAHASNSLREWMLWEERRNWHLLKKIVDAQKMPIKIELPKPESLTDYLVKQLHWQTYVVQSMSRNISNFERQVDQHLEKELRWQLGVQ